MAAFEATGTTRDRIAGRNEYGATTANETERILAGLCALPQESVQ
jgi:hypothetical protein